MVMHSILNHVEFLSQNYLFHILTLQLKEQMVEIFAREKETK